VKNTGNTGNPGIETEGIGSESERESEAQSKSNFEDQVDALFKRPLAEFIGARNDLAARLKREGRADEASVVKALAKPSVSAWVVNQLYWYHREEFDELLRAGGRVRQSQASRTSAHAAGMREALEARREALSRLSESATALMRDAGHNPTPDTIHRITTTLEAVSAYASLSDGPIPGRLNRDLDPPGFESLASVLAGAVTTKASEELEPATPSQDPESSSTETDSSRMQTDQDAPPVGEVEKTQELEEARQARIAAAKASLDGGERSLAEATARARRLEAAREKADAEANQAEKELRELEERLKKASAAWREAAERSQRIAAEAKEATKAVEDAERNLEEASKELESLIRDSAAR
jgi:hypothetical protein